VTFLLATKPLVVQLRRISTVASDKSESANSTLGCGSLLVLAALIFVISRACGGTGGGTPDLAVTEVAVVATISVESPTVPALDTATPVPTPARTPLPPTPPRIQQTVVAGIDNTADSVIKARVLRNANVRSGPTTESEVVELAVAGEELTVYGERNGWVQLDAAGTRWIGSTMVEVICQQALDNESEPTESDLTEAQLQALDDFMLLIDDYTELLRDLADLLGQLAQNETLYKNSEWLSYMYAVTGSIEEKGAAIRDLELSTETFSPYGLIVEATKSYDRGVNYLRNGLAIESVEGLQLSVLEIEAGNQQFDLATQLLLEQAALLGYQIEP
jgi:hypothetical protein